MATKIFHKTIPLLFYLALTTSGIAQNKTIVKASVDRNKILIGESINLNIEVTIPSNQSIRFLSIDSFPHFEFLEKQKVDTSAANNGILLKQTIRITSFDSGHWAIPSFVLAKNIATDTIPIEVGFSNFDPNQDYHDIKDIIEVYPSDNKNWLWYILGGGLLLILLLIGLLRKKKPVSPIIKSILSPYEEAMKQLESFKKNNYSPKQYYSELVDVFRIYIFRKRGILSLQKTTDDLILQLMNIELDKEQHVQLSQALRLSDFVKFAKYIPSSEDSSDIFETIKNSIVNIEKLEQTSSTGLS